MPRILISPRAIRSGTVTVTDPGDLHHLLDVLRVQEGDRLECLDGEGHRYVGPIVQCSARAIVITIEEETILPATRVAVTLAPALLRPERFDWLIQKATELGVAAIAPVITQRTIVRPSLGSLDHKLTRWQRIVREAAAQCGRSALPRIERPRPFHEVVSLSGPRAPGLIPTLAITAHALKEEVATLTGITAIMVLIGPEGDFTADEIAEAQRHGARPISLGSYVLRSETAALAVLAVLQQSLL